MSQPVFSPILTCPSCGYDLQGLPEGRVCPECGLPCEREGLVYFRRVPYPAWLRIFMLVFWMFILATAWSSLVKRRWSMIGLAVISASTVVRLFRPVRRQAPVVMLSSRAIVIFADDGTWHKIPLSETASVRHSRVDGSVRVYDRSSAETARFGQEELGGWDKAKQLTTQIEALLATNQPQRGDSAVARGVSRGETST